MKIPLREFVLSVLLGAKLLDKSLPHLETTKRLLRQWQFSDEGAVYLPPDKRDQMNLADVILMSAKWKTSNQTYVMQ